MLSREEHFNSNQEEYKEAFLLRVLGRTLDVVHANFHVTSAGGRPSGKVPRISLPSPYPVESVYGSRMGQAASGGNVGPKESFDLTKSPALRSRPFAPQSSSVKTV